MVRAGVSKGLNVCGENMSTTLVTAHTSKGEGVEPEVTSGKELATLGTEQLCEALASQLTDLPRIVTSFPRNFLSNSNPTNHFSNSAKLRPTTTYF